ncbi:MAG TPA: lysylphosphatidylglycerol synthase transmembrane domain-containing protein [Dongiaceae bacterium]|nr:lysylphosphatidylglycerol synthase transmembrane domain-containing protein [Dongiaceae bacterium]
MDGTSHDTAAKRSNPRRARFSWLFGLLALAAVVLVASRFTEIERFVEIARAAQPAWLLAAIGLQTLTYACAAGVWHVTLLRAGLHHSFWSILPLGLAKLFADQVLPTGGIGGTLLVVSGLGRRGVPHGIGMAALLIGLLSYYVAYLIAVVAALAILYAGGALNPAMIGGAAVFLLVAFSIPAIVLVLRHWSRLTSGDGWLAALNRRLIRIPGVSALISAMAESPGTLLRDPWSFAGGTILQLLIFVLDAATLWVMLRALGIDEPPAAAAAAFVMASLAATIGPMPLGLGTFEAVCVGMLHLQGLSVEVALTATLLLRGFTFWLPMLPGLALARRELPSRTIERPGAAR